MTAVGVGLGGGGMEQKGERTHGVDNSVVIVGGGGYQGDKW